MNDPKRCTHCGAPVAASACCYCGTVHDPLAWVRELPGYQEQALRLVRGHAKVVIG